MSITLYGRLNSVNVQKVVWTLEELGLAYGHVPLGGKFKGLDDPEYLALNPNGKVPTLRDGDVVVWESHAIVRYLAAAYGAGSLWPTSPGARAVADQWTDWALATFQRAWLAVFDAVIRTPEAKRVPERIAEVQREAERLYGMLDRQLEGRAFLAGDTLTYADIVIGASMYRWTTMPIERTPMPNLDAWSRRLNARPAFQKGVCVSYEEMVGVPPAH